MSTVLSSEKELSQAVEESRDSIELDVDLGKRVVRIKATGKAAWGVCISTIIVAGAILASAYGGSPAIIDTIQGKIYSENSSSDGASGNAALRSIQSAAPEAVGDHSQIVTESSWDDLDFAPAAGGDDFPGSYAEPGSPGADNEESPPELHAANSGEQATPPDGNAPDEHQALGSSGTDKAAPPAEPGSPGEQTHTPGDSGNDQAVVIQDAPHAPMAEPEPLPASRTKFYLLSAFLAAISLAAACFGVSAMRKYRKYKVTPLPNGHVLLNKK